MDELLELVKGWMLSLQRDLRALTKEFARLDKRLARLERSKKPPQKK